MRQEPGQYNLAVTSVSESFFSTIVVVICFLHRTYSYWSFSVIIRSSSRAVGDDSMTFQTPLLKTTDGIKMIIHFHNLFRQRNVADLYVNCVRQGQTRSKLPFKAMLYGKQTIVSL